MNLNKESARIHANMVVQRRRFIGSVLLMILTLSGCAEQKSSPSAVFETPKPGPNLKLLATYPLAIKEPSGMAIAADFQSLWIVSDRTKSVHNVTLEGKAIHSFRVGIKDLEGIAVVDENTIAVVSERTGVLAQYSRKGKLIRQEKLNLPDSDNSGLEGVDFDTENQRFFVLKEKDPGLLMVLDRHMKEVRRTELHFATDYSAVEFEPVKKHLWVLSDQSKTVYVLNEDLKPLAQFYTDVLQQEGFSVDYARKRLYVASDKTEQLYVFEFAEY